MDWMANIADILFDVPINNIILPGSHDSGAYIIDWSVVPVINNKTFERLYTWSDRLACVKSISEDWTKTHNLSIYSQLLSGIRYLDLRICYINNTFYLAHTFICEPLQKVLADISKFLLEHRDEILILRFSNEYENRSTMTKDRNDKAIDLIYNHLNAFLCEQDNKFPTYGEILESNKNIIMFYRQRHTPKTFIWNYRHYYSNWTTTVDIPEKLAFLEELLKKMETTNLNELQFTLTPGASDITKNTVKRVFIPCSSGGLEPLSHDIQEELTAFLNKNKDFLHKLSVISTDYPTPQTIQTIINLNTKIDL